MGQEKSGYDSRLFEGLLFGGLLGAALGVIFAPLAGEDTREKIKQKLKELDLDAVINRFSEAFEAGKAEAEKVVREQSA